MKEATLRLPLFFKEQKKKTDPWPETEKSARREGGGWKGTSVSSTENG